MNQKVVGKIETFYGQYPIRRYPKSHILIYADEDPKYIYHLVSGQVRVHDIDQQGNEVELLTFRPPAFFPMSWAINKTPNEYFYVVKTAATLRQAPVDDCLEFIKDNKDVLFDLLGRVYKGTDIILRRMAHLMGGNATNRVLFELIVEEGRATKNSNATHVLDLSESGLAVRSGLSRETVSRVIKDLKSKQLVEIKRNNIMVLDYDRLKTMLGHSL